MSKSYTPLSTIVATLLMGSAPLAIGQNCPHHEIVSKIEKEKENAIFHEFTEGKHSFSTTDAADVKFEAQTPSPNSTFLSAESSEIHFQSGFHLNFSTQNTAESYGIDLSENDSLSFGETFSLNVQSNLLTQNNLLNQENAINSQTGAIRLDNTKLTTTQLPSVMRLTATANVSQALAPNTIQTTVALYLLENSSFQYQGSLHLSALNQTDKHTSLGYAALVDESSLSIQSDGNTFIMGNIETVGQSTVNLNLTHASDRFIGNVYAKDGHNSSGLQNSDINLTIANGATWNPIKDNGFGNLYWNEGGVIDLSLTEHFVRLGLPTTSESHQPSTTFIEDGAVLRVRITDKNKSPTIVDGKEVYLVNIENVQAQHNDNVQIIVQVIDERSDKQAKEALAIPLLHYEKNSGGITLKSDITEYETALGKFQSLAQFGSGFSGGFVINDIRTDLIAPSSLANNQLDTISTELISVEKVAARLQSQLIERSVPGHQRGLWLDYTYSQTELSYGEPTREHTLVINALTIGYDTKVSLPLMNDTYVGALTYFSQGEVDFETGNSNTDQYGLGFYAGGLSTEKKYRLLLQAHWGQIDTNLSSQAFFINGISQKQLDFNSKTMNYGAGLYMGFVQTFDEPSPWFIEPFISGYTYWVNNRETTPNEEIEFKAEKNHQSIVKLGATLAYQSKKTLGNTFYSQLAWVHRFGKSIDVVGKEKTQFQNFETEDLQESWGELTLGGTWMFSKHGQLQFKGMAGYAKVVNPRYEVSASLNYAF